MCVVVQLFCLFVICFLRSGFPLVSHLWITWHKQQNKIIPVQKFINQLPPNLITTKKQAVHYIIIIKCSWTWSVKYSSPPCLALPPSSNNFFFLPSSYLAAAFFSFFFLLEALRLHPCVTPTMMSYSKQFLVRKHLMQYAFLLWTVSQGGSHLRNIPFFLFFSNSSPTLHLDTFSSSGFNLFVSRVLFSVNAAALPITATLDLNVP